MSAPISNPTEDAKDILKSVSREIEARKTANMERQRQQVGEESEEIGRKTANMEEQRQQAEGEESESELAQIYRSPGLISIVSGINKLYNVCMDHCKKMQENLSTIKAEKDALTAKLQKAVQEVQDLTQRQVQWGDQRQLLIDTLQGIVRMNDEHRAEMQQQSIKEQFARQQAEAKVRELKDKLEAVLRNKEYLTGMLLRDSNTRSADANKRQLEQQNEMPCHSRSNTDEGCSSQKKKKRNEK